MKKLFLSALLAISLFACEKSEFLSEGNYYFIRHKGATMPVWVKGNLESGVFLITVHGGPGSSGHEFAVTKSFTELEKDYAIVYWDQRFSGLSQGDPKKSTLSIDQFVEDVDVVVDFVRQQFNQPKLFMLGHSWGGGLSAAWVGRNNNQQKIQGWIDVDGSVYDSLEVQAVKHWTLERVPAKIAEGKDLKFWQYVIDWYQANPAPVYSTKEPYIFAAALDTSYNAAALADSNQLDYAKLLLRSPYSLAYFTNKVDARFADGLDFRPELRRINIPALVLWGKDDPTLPIELASFTYNTLGTAPDRKKKVEFEKCGHSPHYEQPTRFVAVMREFVEKWR
ncbi:MAG: alpha/beta hydrolase [Haliscomenobacter sp.]|uniref:alpha/beta fold hydrolase n=1 Tax=Haliscomenobacter sp. TaxID=2717303 RepID=UPI0029AA990E|nr:alpha/beta hydrolase [Haliscomenobacter sp.]MDX2071368.1 alpha/beta hydrolase [Haliscomenobacter sp.]